MQRKNNLRAVDLNLLVILDALLSERHLSRAAEKLHMSQPAVSHALARLRALLDDPLLVRGRGGFSPTTRALELARPLADALQGVRSVLGGAAFDPGTAQRVFRIAMSDYGAAIALPALARCVREQAPGIDLHISYASRAAMVAGVSDADIDLALAVFPQLPESLQRETLLEDTFVCALDPTNQNKALTMAEYLRRPHVLVAAGDPSQSTEVDTALAHMGVSRRVALRLPHWTVAPSVIAGTDLILTVARRALCGEAAQKLTIVPVPFEIPRFSFEQIWHQRTQGDAGLAWLRSVVAYSMRSGSAPTA